MEIKKMYYPDDRILEDFGNKIQKRFGYEPGMNETFELLTPRIAKVIVTTREKDGTTVREPKWVSLYKVTLGTNLPFQAGIITNYESSVDEHAAFRLLNTTDGIIDFEYGR